MDKKSTAREAKRDHQIGCKRRESHEFSCAGESVGKWIATSPP